MENINIEEIMDKIRKEIKEKEYRISELSFADIPLVDGTGVEVSDEFSFGEYEKEFYSMKSRWAIPTEIEFTSSNPMIQMIKRIVRKMCRCVTFQMTTMQNEFNGSVVRTNGQIRNYIEENEKQKKELQNRIEELEQIIKQMREK